MGGSLTRGALGRLASLRVGGRIAMAAGAVLVIAVSSSVAYAFGASPSASTSRSYTVQKLSVSERDRSAAAGAGSDAGVVPAASRAASDPVGSPNQSSQISPPPAAVLNPEGCPGGDHQREVEGHLTTIGGFGTITVDGLQSTADCAAIKAFQTRFGISPSNGMAGELTVQVARRIVISGTPEERAKCDGGDGSFTVCVDLTQQTVWAIKGGSVVFGPTVTRTGMAGYATTAGTYHVYDRGVRTWSVPYKVWLPYWQNFNNGMGLHETTTYLHASAMGSHGCVNLLHNDAVALYDAATLGTTVQVFGRRAGT